jgi:hypothetical protein
MTRKIRLSRTMIAPSFLNKQLKKSSMKTTLCFMLLFVGVQLLNAQAQDTIPKSTGETIIEVIEVGQKVLSWFKKTKPQKATQPTAVPTQTRETTTGNPQPVSFKGSLTEPTSTENPVIIEETPRKKSAEPKSTESPVIPTTSNDIEEMPDLSVKKQSGIIFTIKQWQQVGSKIIIKMIIENTDANQPAQHIKVCTSTILFMMQRGIPIQAP